MNKYSNRRECVAVSEISRFTVSARLATPSWNLGACAAQQRAQRATCPAERPTTAFFHAIYLHTAAGCQRIGTHHPSAGRRCAREKAGPFPPAAATTRRTPPTGRARRRSAGIAARAALAARGLAGSRRRAPLRRAHPVGPSARVSGIAWGGAAGWWVGAWNLSAATQATSLLVHVTCTGRDKPSYTGSQIHQYSSF